MTFTHVNQVVSFSRRSASSSSGWASSRCPLPHKEGTPSFYIGKRCQAIQLQVAMPRSQDRQQAAGLSRFGLEGNGPWPPHGGGQGLAFFGGRGIPDKPSADDDQKHGHRRQQRHALERSDQPFRFGEAGKT